MGFSKESKALISSNGDYHLSRKQEDKNFAEWLSFSFREARIGV